MKTHLIISLVFGVAQFAQARAVREPPVGQLFEYAPLVIVGEVTSVTPLGVETTLSYPTLHGVVFHWLRVTTKVDALLKGNYPQGGIDVAMLAVKSGDNLVNGPLMLSPEQGQKYVMFLAPSSKKDVYASILAPYDEANAIFILDRKSETYDYSRVVNEDYMKQCTEKKDFVWSLVREDGQLSKTGPTDVVRKYKSQIEKKGRDYTIALEWKIRTNAGGWNVDVPKDAPEVKAAPEPNEGR
jgi:hypothetical protein